MSLFMCAESYSKLLEVSYWYKPHSIKAMLVDSSSNLNYELTDKLSYNSKYNVANRDMPET